MGTGQAGQVGQCMFHVMLSCCVCVYRGKGSLRAAIGNGCAGDSSSGCAELMVAGGSCCAPVRSGCWQAVRALQAHGGAPSSTPAALAVDGIHGMGAAIPTNLEMSAARVACADLASRLL